MAGTDFEGRIEVHGGITYQDRKLKHARLDLPPGTWIGFDCAHHMDGQSPDFIRDNPIAKHLSIISRGSTFKDEDYITREIHSMIEQLEEPVELNLDLPL